MYKPCGRKLGRSVTKKLDHNTIKLANSRCGYWRMAEMLNTVITKEIIAKLGYTSLLDYYLIVYEN